MVGGTCEHLVRLLCWARPLSVGKFRSGHASQTKLVEVDGFAVLDVDGFALEAEKLSFPWHFDDRLWFPKPLADEKLG